MSIQNITSKFFQTKISLATDRVHFVPRSQRVEVNEARHFSLMNVLDSQSSEHSAQAKHGHAHNREDYYYELVDIPELCEVRAFSLLYLTDLVDEEVDNRNNKYNLENDDNDPEAA